MTWTGVELNREDLLGVLQLLLLLASLVLVFRL